ncbi:hypothetical protein NEMIN01_0184 [Nematocida minor]|uniref:uncharacterized protein n=1 Tax=Nematocida minor TaxID=1912983 RepID=UPI0022203DEA|nr:uncharacterized protein NEMIN01_0080 [Nematocida minor]XP_051332086.1 uncharacterized protein NEMIN01_0184 [Nematocida minor]KAI5188816.1 hypothetical protein NEMIN01_0080 [Nematocida minor]KAI5188920.1 hypothetical protein NEMIN01_0184 [Nematocida minor]
MLSENERSLGRDRNTFKNGKGESYKGVYIPEASVYDEQPAFAAPREFTISQKTVTVFGYSPSNLEHILRKFRDIGEIKEISYGKNWMDVKYEREKCMFLALQESGAIINGEMIGVVQKARKNINVGKIEKSNLLIHKEEGVLGRILTYLFG